MRQVLFIAILVVTSLAFLAGGSWGAEFCVDPNGGGTHMDLQSALDDAEGNGVDDVIQVVQGEYKGNFTYDSSQGRSITLLGGYTPGCASRVVDPSKTTLDGDGSDRVLYLSNSNGGDIIMEGFTIQNGGGADTGGGVYAYSHSDSGTAGNITLENNTITGNTAASDYGGVYAYSSSNSGTLGNITLTNNTITGNTAASDYGGVSAHSFSDLGTAGSITLTNNTITGNTASDYYGGVSAESYSPSGPGNITLTNNTITGNTADWSGGVILYMYNNTIDVYNNIIWSNTALPAVDIYLFGTGTANGYNNDYSDMTGAWTNSGDNIINADPLFVNPAANDFHLGPGSPCIDAGNPGAPGLPTTDFEGDPRTVGAAPDIGADEFIDICEGDFDGDGDVDGTDLAVFAAGGTEITLEVFAADFGRTDCPPSP